MATITFIFDGETTTLAVPVVAGSPPPTLLAVARDAAVPILSNCGTGACGACLVDVEVLGGGTSPMSDAEGFYLSATGRLNNTEQCAWARLACQYKLSEDDNLRVRFTTNVGCF